MYRLLFGICIYNYIMCYVWFIFSNKEVEYGEDDSVFIKYVVFIGFNVSRGYF